MAKKRAETKKPKNPKDFEALKASGAIVRVVTPSPEAWAFADGDAFFHLNGEFRSQHIVTYDTPAGFVLGFDKSPGEKVVEGLRKVGRVLLGAAANPLLLPILHRLGVKTAPAIRVLERARDLTEDSLVKLIAQEYGDKYLAKVEKILGNATDPHSPGGRKITEEEFIALVSAKLDPDAEEPEVEEEADTE